MNSTEAAIKHISECYIKPKYEVEEAKQPYYLSPWDLVMLSGHYSQKGLMFKKPSHIDDDEHEEYSTNKLLLSLKNSLSLTLVHFYPFAGQLATHVDEDRHESLVFIECDKGPGARFIHAALDMTISDILSPTDVPFVVRSFFDHDKAVNHDGHTMPLLSVQVTELLDGVFIGCSINHLLVDGTSYWNFWNVWSHIHRANGDRVSIPHSPINKRWIPDGYGPGIPLPFTHPDEFISRYEAPHDLRERFFHFSSESIARLKSKANEESNHKANDNMIISSFQALSALVWRSIVRATRVPHDEVHKCTLLANGRHRLDPPLPKNYSGNFLGEVITTATAGELLEHNLGWAALMFHQSVVNFTNKTLRDFFNAWLKSPFVFEFREIFNSKSMSIVSSPRFNVYGNEFGLGKAVAVRSGPGFKSAGFVIAYSGYEGGGSVDLEISLPPDSMRALETDDEFMAYISSPYKAY